MSWTGIGVYGHTLTTFLDALREANTDLLIDIRRFRGMRGPHYRWGNGAALQASLHNSGIQYKHVIELSPTRELRALQRQIDTQGGISKSDRVELSSTFVEGYRSQISPLITKDFVSSLPTNVAFLCVEKNANACHRSVLLQMLKELRRV
jgi:uncharacterized protein (DUF488 family)